MGGAGMAVAQPPGARPAEPHVRLENVTKRFGARVAAVDGISLAIPRGSFTTLLGPSGCGKTTTLRLIAGFYDPDEGDIKLADRRINDLPAHRRGTALVFQDYALFPHMTVRENVAYGLRLARRARARRAGRTRGVGPCARGRAGRRRPGGAPLHPSRDDRVRARWQERGAGG